MISRYDVFKEIFSKLKTLPYNVYDEVPENNPSNPHIRIDANYNIDDSGKNYECIEFYQYINVFSLYKGRKELITIADSVVELLSEDIITDEFVAHSQLERYETVSKSVSSRGAFSDEYLENEFYRQAIIVFKYTVYKNI